MCAFGYAAQNNEKVEVTWIHYFWSKTAKVSCASVIHQSLFKGVINHVLLVAIQNLAELIFIQGLQTSSERTKMVMGMRKKNCSIKIRRHLAPSRFSHFDLKKPTEMQFGASTYESVVLCHRLPSGGEVSITYASEQCSRRTMN